MAVCLGLALVWVVAARLFVGIGFNPTDDGLVVIQSSQLVDGATPHVDIISPRPLGSPLLHVVDVLLPTPLLVTSRAIALIEFLIIAAAGVRLLQRKPLGRWGPSEIALTLIAFMVNLHTFPLLSWHTVDGLLLSTLAFVVLDKAFTEQSARLLRVGLLLAGATPLIKQSFAPVPLIVIAWMVWTVRSGRSPFSRRALLANLPWVLAPGVVYVGWLVVTSSLSQAISQMTSASGIDAIAGLVVTAPSLVALGATVVLVWAVVVARRRNPAGPDPARLTTALQVAGGALIVLALAATFGGQLRYTESWGAVLWWSAAMTAGLWSVADRHVDVPAVAILALGWMTSLSWGYPVPNLMGGLLLVAAVSRGLLLIDAGLGPARRVTLARAATALVVVVCVALAPLSFWARNQTVYRDVPATRSVDLGPLAPDFRGVRAGKMTARYLEQIKQCTAQYPATNLAVVPDNAAVPRLLGRPNPLPLAWWYPLEIPSDRTDLTAAIERVDAAGDYLILFQTFDVSKLSSRRSLPTATTRTELFDYDDGMMPELFKTLTGDIVTCGSFVGRYAQ